MAHPPRSNPPQRSSSGPPSPCITPSTETFVLVVSFMVGAPFSLVSLSSGPTGRRYRSHRSCHDLVMQVHAGSSPEQGPHIDDVVLGHRHREHGGALLVAGAAAAQGFDGRS